MDIFRYKSVARALAIGIGFVACQAGATAVPLVNPTFDGETGWTFQGGLYSLFTTSPTTASNPFGITSNGIMVCLSFCPTSSTSTLSQTVSLVQNHNYELNYYAYNWTFQNGENPVIGAPMQVKLGTEVSKPITVPSSTTPLGPNAGQWEKETVQFTYTGLTGNALLSFMQNFIGVNEFCQPCAGEYLFLSNISLDDQGGPTPPPPPPPPPPVVSEPSSIATLGLGLGTLGLYFRRRRNRHLA